jgi:hypothetical protein
VPNQQTSSSSERPVRPDGVFGFAVDGEFHDPRDWPPAEARELRDIVRVTTGHADIADPLADRRVADMDIMPAVIFMVRKRTRPEYTLDQAVPVGEGGHPVGAVGAAGG